jgi:hypothetical protein
MSSMIGKVIIIPTLSDLSDEKWRVILAERMPMPMPIVVGIKRNFFEIPEHIIPVIDTNVSEFLILHKEDLIPFTFNNDFKEKEFESPVLYSKKSHNLNFDRVFSKQIIKGRKFGKTYTQKYLKKIYKKKSSTTT